MSIEKIVKYKVDAEEAIKETEKLAATQKKAADALKSQQKDAIDGMGAFGMTFGGLKQNFKGLQATGKALFSSIKTGLIATGIGAFLVAIGSLVTYFKSSKEAAEQLEVIMATVGAAFTVLTERFAKFGGAIFKVLKGDFKGAATDIKDTFAGIGEEIRNDIKATQDLAKAAINLRDAEREVNVELAQRRAETSALKIIAEDVTKSTEERLDAAEKAFKIENDLLDKRVANAEEALRIQQEQMAVGNNMEEDLQKEAELQIALANIYEESSGKKLEINNKINSIRKEGLAIIDTEKKAEQDRLDKAVELSNTELELLRTSNLSQQELQLDQAKQKYEKLVALAEKHGQDTTIITEKYNAEILKINKSFEDKTKGEDAKKKADLAKLKADELEILRVSGLNEEQLAVDQATKKYERLLAIAQKYGQDTTFLTEQFNQQLTDIQTQYDEQELAKQKAQDDEKLAQRQMAGQMALDAGQNILSSLASIAETNEKIEKRSLDKQLKEGKISQEQYDKQTAKIEEKALKRKKRMAILQILIDTAMGVAGAIRGAMAMPFPINLVALASGVASVIAGIASAKAVLAEVPGGDDGGGSTPEVDSGGGGGDDPSQIGGDLVPNMENVNQPTLDGGGGNSAVQAYVVENDISNSQALQQDLELQSTL